MTTDFSGSGSSDQANAVAIQSDGKIVAAGGSYAYADGRSDFALVKDGAGRRSSPLDDIRPERWTRAFTEEFLELLWVLKATVTIGECSRR